MPSILNNIMKDLAGSKIFSIAGIERTVCRFFVRQCEKGNRVLLMLLFVLVIFVCISAYIQRNQYTAFIDWNAILPTTAKATTSVDTTNNAKGSKGEGFCRSVLEEVLGLEFIKTRSLEWLVNPETNRRLEIDLYCEERKLGFEIDGCSHHAFIPGFHGTRENFEKSQGRDRLKDELCKKNGVLLIRIPYWVTSPGQDPMHGRDPLPKDMNPRARLLLHISTWPSFEYTYPDLYDRVRLHM
jgi:hypothetical protein